MDRPNDFSDKRQPRRFVPRQASRGRKSGPPSADRPVTHRELQSYVAKVAPKIIQEPKFFDVNDSVSLSLDYNATNPFSVCQIPQGAADTNRVGDAITVTSLEYSFCCKFNGDAAAQKQPNVVRLILFAWKPFTSDVAPTPLKVLIATGGVAVTDVGLTHDGRDQFALLMDHAVVVDGAKQQMYNFRGKMPLNLKVQWKAGSTTNHAGGIYWMACADAVPASGVQPTLHHWGTRVNFVDA